MDGRIETLLLLALNDFNGNTVSSSAPVLVADAANPHGSARLRAVRRVVQRLVRPGLCYFSTSPMHRYFISR